jgi:lysophospholipase L1-like esterase
MLALLVGLSCPAQAAFAADIKVACVGNSITYGYGLSSPYYESYPTQLDTLLGPGYEVSNFGVSGKTMIKAVNDAYWTQPAFGNARASLPNVVVIELGTNDSKDYIWPWYKQNFKADYAAMVDTFKVLSTKPQVWVTLQPPANNPDWNMYDTTIDRQVNPAILEVAKQKALPVIDLHTAMKGRGEWMQSDSVHPNAAGAKALAGIVAKTMAKTVKIEIPPTCLGLGCTSSLFASTQSKAYGYWWYRNDTLLSKDTLPEFRSPIKAGRYRVSVKVDSAGESRVVSPVYELANDLVGIQRKRSNPSVRVVAGASGSVRVESSLVLGPVVLTLWDARGELVANGTLKSGVYHYRAKGRDFQNVGSVVVPH